MCEDRLRSSKQKDSLTNYCEAVGQMVIVDVVLSLGVVTNNSSQRVYIYT